MRLRYPSRRDTVDNAVAEDVESELRQILTDLNLASVILSLPYPHQ